MTDTLTNLIDKQDNVELIEDQILAILKDEAVNQVALATTAGKPDPSLWALRLFKERATPWEEFLNIDDTNPSAKIPIVNIWIDNENFTEGASNISERQKCVTIYNIDVYGYGASSSDGGSGHNPGDRAAALMAQRGMRLVRNILMADINTWLQARGLVWQRWPQSISYFQPALDALQAQRIVAARLALRVGFNELAPQEPFVNLCELATTITLDDNNEVVLEWDFTP